MKELFKFHGEPDATINPKGMGTFITAIAIKSYLFFIFECAYIKKSIIDKNKRFLTHCKVLPDKQLIIQ